MSDTKNGTDLEGLAKLREPFKPEQINQLPKGGVMLDYVGHAHITERLLDVDPLWNWNPLGWNDDGSPHFETDEQGRPVGLWIGLTVCGVTRRGYGTVEPHKHEKVKELIGDAIRNAAMRFGCGLELWMKERNGSPPGASTGAPPAPSGSAASLPSVVTCDACGFLYEQTNGLKVIASKYDGKKHQAGDPVFHCTECGKWSPVIVPAAAPPVEEPSDDLPF